MAQQDWEIVLSATLEMSPDKFATAWNELAEAREIGEAHVEKTSGEHFDISLVATILISVSTDTASNIISALIMKILEKRGATVNALISSRSKGLTAPKSSWQNYFALRRTG